MYNQLSYSGLIEENNGSISLKITCVEFTSSSMWSVNSAMHLDERIEFAPPYVLDFVGNLTHN